MQKTSLDAMPCPVARSLERVGEWWSILIIRDAFQGLTRFDEFQQSLQLSPTILTRRLKYLVESGIFEKRLYHPRPARYEYLLTERGNDFFPVIATLFHWGNQHFAPEGPAVLLVDRRTGTAVEPVLLDKRTGQPLRTQDVTLTAGSVRSDIINQRLALMQGKQSKDAKQTSHIIEPQKEK
ncbi:helix-turn-helix transcriptional regulator [Yersinia massiliensis]|jgi:DNA-binding HxlR family transcriptional regulator|uniref:Transcriptional regulator n=1 Tax=Yersinia massiliensis TaxID=419257 RepID=A0A2R4NRH0_9GAMM|nr:MULTISPECIES: helix-turn-helix domain-containing protein [Yersinia]HEC1648811.1 helix-turn-helix transcriptional regulator [Yersinia enterocolitica]AVX38725.1 transcriptional regulator [Yersinia massiliensis]MDA5547139.1 helix-turn-helix domain-containing protein [Yersinia massiliensis]NIL25208.1 helix-turn-helix transcriptional regulator [Yersinia massiliensis]OWF73287.1 acyl dehydratase [Yersinia frederiksenii]